MKFHRAFAVLAAFGFAVPITVKAGLGTFSQDGTLFYLVGQESRTGPLQLFKINLKSNVVGPISAPAEADEIVAVGLDGKGQLIATTPAAIWIQPASGEKWEVLTKAPTGAEFTEACVEPTANRIILAAKPNGEPLPEDRSVPAIFVFDLQKRQLMEVFCRRVDFVQGLTVASRGQLFFGHRCDLWHGVLVPDVGPSGDRYFLAAYRCAPLAVPETNLGNESGLCVYQVAAGDDFLVVEVSRWGGSGFGSLVRLPRPPDLSTTTYEVETHNKLLDRYRIYRSAFERIEEIDGADKCHSIAATPDGKSVWVVSRHSITEYTKGEESRDVGIDLPW